MPKVLTAARVRVPPTNEADYFATLRELCQFAEDRKSTRLNSSHRCISYAGAPIINQPQVAILGIGAIEKRPKVVTLPDGTDTIAIRTMGMVSMSYDHRVVDGADADRFLADVKRALEDFPEGAI